MKHKNNFDFLRLIFAIFVIITHSYPLTGFPEVDFLTDLTSYQLSFSHIGVKGFFVISGYLIFKSLLRSNSLFEFYKKRSLRLFPALFVVLLLTLLYVPFIYDSNYGALLQNASFWTYLPNNFFLLNLQHSISGVFETAPKLSAINGSLWTIPYEFGMYVLVSLLFFTRSKEKLTAGIVWLVFVLLGYLSFSPENSFHDFNYILHGKSIVDFGSFFFAGAVFATLKIKINRTTNMVAAGLFVLSIVAIVFHQYKYIQLITFPFCVLVFGLNSSPYINAIGEKIGDLSYGIYLYAFPVQQSLYHFFKLDPVGLMLPSVVLASGFAFLSWHLIEKRALSLKTSPVSINAEMSFFSKLQVGFNSRVPYTNIVFLSLVFIFVGGVNHIQIKNYFIHSFQESAANVAYSNISACGVSGENLWANCTNIDQNSKLIINGLLAETVVYPDHLTCRIPQSVLDTKPIQLEVQVEMNGVRSNPQFLDYAKSNEGHIVVSGSGMNEDGAVWLICQGHNESVSVMLDGINLTTVYYADHVTAEIPEAFRNEEEIKVKLINGDNGAESDQIIISR